ncbi:unnamed protein product [Nippostrongylus brasiliensis]|uniref:Secreted protein n=1 Tax=Nippostrongylus brasiliensis TaxID=27835 RepID=A0A0N4YKW4_NIPBR|nr:unnamed protein product [Nippostrongylus brasiliensis]
MSLMRYATMTMLNVVAMAVTHATPDTTVVTLIILNRTGLRKLGSYPAEDDWRIVSLNSPPPRLVVTLQRVAGILEMHDQIWRWVLFLKAP